jgi:hypothetical protein
MPGSFVYLALLPTRRAVGPRTTPPAEEPSTEPAIVVSACAVACSWYPCVQYPAAAARLRKRLAPPHSGQAAGADAAG